MPAPSVAGRRFGSPRPIRLKPFVRPKPSGVPAPQTQLFSSPSSSFTSGAKPRWKLVIQGLDYARKGEFVSVSNLEWTARLNAFDELRFTVSTSDPAIGQFYVWTRWVELWLDGSLKFRGFPVRADVSLDAQTMTVQCFDQLVPFRYRVFGRADRPDLLQSTGNFENSDLATWTEVGDADAVEETTIVNQGSKSAKITSAGGGYISKFVNYSHTYPPGLIERLAFDFLVAPGADVPGFGLVAQLLATDPDDDRVYMSQVLTTDDLSRGGWHQLSCDLLIAKANTTYLLEVRLYGAPSGCYFDRVRLVRNEATTLQFPGEDQAMMFKNIIEYGQDSNEGKSTLGISTSCPATGVDILVGYPHADHRSLMSAIDELAARTSAPDWDLEYGVGATTFKTYYPQKGDQHDEWLLEVGRNIVGGSLDVDGSQVVTSAIVIGEGGDFERDEGGYVNTIPMSGLVLEEVIRAEVGSPVRFLDEIAEEHVGPRNQLTAIPRLTIADPDRELIHGMEVGDRVPARLSVGLTQIDGRSDFRVVAKRTPQSADRVMLDLIPYPS